MLFTYLLALIPVSLVLGFIVPISPSWVFLSAVLAIVPLAEWIRRAAE